MYGEPGGSLGLIESENHYGGYYVRWNYGVDVRGEAITSLSSVRPSMLMPIDGTLYRQYVACRAWSKEQKPILEKILCQLEKRRISSHS
jgi:hypothetical protein